MTKFISRNVFALCLITLASAASAADPNNKKLYALPRPGDIKIDGKLEDWDRSGAIEVFVSPDTRVTRHAKLSMMYDDDAMYLAAWVKDSTPMVNRYDPKAMADKAWKPDVCQFRLVTDPAVPFNEKLSEFTDKLKDGVQKEQPVQVQLWYYTDEKKPCLMVTHNFKYEPIRPEWGPHGVAPDSAFTAAYLADADGGGYTFEYRIPWETLSAKSVHPKANDRVRGNLQIHWGDESGLESSAGGWAYDLMCQPGFPFQSMESWGTIIFSPTGKLDASIVAGSTSAAPRAEPTTLEFKYDLPQESEVTVSLYDQSNRLVKNIVAQEKRKAGAQIEKWNGLDEADHPLPAGQYTWKGIYHEPITTRYVMSVANSGQPAWKTADGSGGWGGDYGPPMDIKVAGDRLVMTWGSGEAAPSLIGTDLSGKKKWGLTHRHSSYLATDSKRFFAAPEDHVEAFEAASGKPLAFGNGSSALVAPPGASDEKKENRVTGLACHNGRLYVSYGVRNLVAVYDANSGELLSTARVEAPGRLAGTPGGDVLVISGQQVVSLNQKGEIRRILTSDLDRPNGITVDAKGMIYVSNHGKLQNVSVFSSDGKFLRSIGKKGGRPSAGRFDRDGMNQPAGICIAPDGKLWVPESHMSPKRISVWDAATGKYLNQFFGGCSYSPVGWIDPANPTELFHDNHIWKIDLDKGTWEPYSTFYQQQNANQFATGNGGFSFPFRTVTAENGKQYGFSEVHGFGTIQWIRDGDFFRPIGFLFRNYANPQMGVNEAFEVTLDRKKYPSDVVHYWGDANGDGTVQENEIRALPKGIEPSFWLDARLRLWMRNGMVFTPTAVDVAGLPTYDFTKPAQLGFDLYSVWTDERGDEPFGYSITNEKTSKGIGLAGFGSNGATRWATLPIMNWNRALNFSQIKPGPIFGATCGLGVAGDFTGVARYFPFYDIFRKDGLYVGRILKPGVLGEHGPDVFYVEFLYGQMVKPKGMDRYFLIGGDQDVRILEVLGLNTIKDLPGGSFTISPEQEQTVRKAWDEFNQQSIGRSSLEIVSGGAGALQNAKPISRDTEGGRRFEAAAAYDNSNLYVRYNVKAPAKLINVIPDPQVIFKGGNLLDIQIATDPAAPSDRKKPAPGDLRLLISRQDGKARAVVYRPKVKDYKSQPIKLVSPTGSETFDAIEATDRISLQDYAETADGFSVTAVIPLDLIGWKPEAGKEVRMDLGYVFGNADGTQAVLRAYWTNDSFTANVLNDIPHESRLEPGEWGKVVVK